MRIVKSQAVGALRREINALSEQGRRCQGQMGKLSGFEVTGMSGKGASALGQQVRTQASVVRSHLLLYQTLADADRRHVGLVEALPTTSPGVLDTAVAQDRVDRAQRQVRLLERKMDVAVARANRTNSDLAFLARSNNQSAGAPVPYINVNAIRLRYRSLIASQQAIADLNEEVLRAAEAYEQDAMAAYQAVNTSCARGSLVSVRSYLSHGSWGDLSWVQRANTAFSHVAQASSGGPKVPELVRQLLMGELAASGAVAKGDPSTTVLVGGVPVTGAVSGEALGYSASIKPYGKGDDKLYDKDSGASMGFKAKAEGHVAKGTAQVDAPLAQLKAEGSLVTGAASGSLGATLFKDGVFAPGLEAKAEAEASVASAEVSGRLGTSELNYHRKAKGELLGAKAEAGVTVGKGGVEAKVDAEAYVAKGELSGGVSLLGITIDATVEGKVGGVGGKAGAKAGPTALEAELGLGMGLGLGAKVKVDWSGLPKTLSDGWDLVGGWWDDIVSKKKKGA